jgi:hypothetical protein
VKYACGVMEGGLWPSRNRRQPSPLPKRRHHPHHYPHHHSSTQALKHSSKSSRSRRSRQASMAVHACTGGTLLAALCSVLCVCFDPADSLPFHSAVQRFCLRIWRTVSHPYPEVPYSTYSDRASKAEQSRAKQATMWGERTRVSVASSGLLDVLWYSTRPSDVTRRVSPQLLPTSRQPASHNVISVSPSGGFELNQGCATTRAKEAPSVLTSSFGML